MNATSPATCTELVSPYLSRAELLSNFDGDLAFVHDIVDIFLTRCPDPMANIWSAAESGDLAATREAAHALKGCASYFDRGDLSACAEEIEHLGANDIARLPALLRDLEQHAGDLSWYLVAEMARGGEAADRRRQHAGA